MNISKLILLVCPAFLVSLLLIGNSAQAAEIQSQPTTPVVQVSSASPTPASTTLQFRQKSNPIRDSLGCNCVQCVQSQNQLQGKLPTFGL